jgi:carbon storage regulator
MLVLSRRRDESIMIGDDVEITIVDVRGDKVRLGITAPKSIPVHRREIYDAIQREKAEAKKAARETCSASAGEIRSAARRKGPARTARRRTPAAAIIRQAANT